MAMDRKRRRNQRRALNVVLAGAIMLVASGCAGLTPSDPGFCVPQLEVEPAQAQPGREIVVSSVSSCDAVMPEDGWTVTAAPVGDTANNVTVTTSDHFDGEFSISFMLPPSFPAGEAYVQIQNWDYGACTDTGGCTAADGSFVVSSKETTNEPSGEARD
jgi:hypothetical protein